MLKKIVALLGVAVAGLAFAKRRQNARSDADLWHEATTTDPR